MTDTQQIKAYAVQQGDQLVPLDAKTIVFRFPSGGSLEIEWNQPDGLTNPPPPSITVWGGRVPQESWSNDHMKSLPSRLMIIPAASNMILIEPL